MKLGEQTAALVAELREGTAAIEAKHEQRTTPPRVSEICPFRESFLRELAPKDQETFRSLGAYLIRRLAVEEQGPGDESESTLLGDTQGLYAETRNLEQVCAFVADVNSSGNPTEDEVIELITRAGVLLGAVGDLFEVAVQALQEGASAEGGL